MTISYLIILGLIVSFSVGIDYAFAASVSVPQGTSVPGCETTNQCFIPYEVSVPVSGKVIWSNNDSAAHTVTGGSSADGPSGVFDSSLFMAGTTFSHTFSQEGVYPYFCMVHPWMNGLVKVGNYEDSSWLPKDPIEVVMNDSEFYLDQPNQVVRAKVEMRDFSPSDGQYFMKVTFLPTGKVLRDSEIYPRAAGNDLYSVQIAYPLSASDIMVGGQALLGEYEVLVYSEKGVHTGSAKFTILESSTQPKTESVSENKVVIDANSDKGTYDENQTIQVTGSVNDILYGNVISIRVIAPNGNVISIDQSHIDSEGLFIYSLRTNNNLFSENGDYIIQLLYGTDEIRKDILVSYIGHPPPKPEPISVPKVEPVPKPVEPTPKIEKITPKVIEKITPSVVKQTTAQKTNGSEADYTVVLIILVIVIVVVIVGIIALNKRNKTRGDPMSEDYDLGDYDTDDDEPKKKMEW